MSRLSPCRFCGKNPRSYPHLYYIPRRNDAGVLYTLTETIYCTNYLNRQCRENNTEYYGAYYVAYDTIDTAKLWNCRNTHAVRFLV